MNLFNQKIGGLIKYFKLEEWYSSLTPDQQEKLKEHYVGNPHNVDTGNITASTTAAGFLWPIGQNAFSSNDLEVADLVLTKALELDDNIISKHYALLGLIDLTYKRRDVDPKAIEKCKEYCLMDINIAGDFLKAWNEDNFFYPNIVKTKDFDKFIDAKNRGEKEKDIFIRLGYPVDEMLKEWYKTTPLSTLRIPSFTRLAMIFEKEGKTQDAIEVCKKAIALGLKETKQDPYEKRIAKLEKKLLKE